MVSLTTKYSIAESKVAATHYGDDAQESVNKNLILGMQKEILYDVMQMYRYFEMITIDFADRYAELEKLDKVHAFDE
jgi:hypothetical protein